MRKVLFVFCCLVQVSLQSQNLISVVLLDSVSSQPIEFANAGVLGKGLGTVSDEKGHFTLVIPDSLKEQRLFISMIGYHSKSVPLKNLQGTTTINMAPHGVSLSEISVAAPRLKMKIVGNNTTGKMITAGFTKNNLGAEIAVRLKIKHAQTELRQFKLNIVTNTLAVKPIFRLNIYNIGKDGTPDENILSQNIIIEPEQKTGLIDLDLSQYKIVVDDDVFISIEWIKDLGDAKGLYFSTRMGGADTYYKEASQDKWQKIPGIGVGLHAQIAY